MVLKTRSCSLFTTLRRSSPSAAMAEGSAGGAARVCFVVWRPETKAEGPQKLLETGTAPVTLLRFKSFAVSVRSRGMDFYSRRSW